MAFRRRRGSPLPCGDFAPPAIRSPASTTQQVPKGNWKRVPGVVTPPECREAPSPGPGRRGVEIDVSAGHDFDCLSKNQETQSQHRERELTNFTLLVSTPSSPGVSPQELSDWKLSHRLY